MDRGGRHAANFDYRLGVLLVGVCEIRGKGEGGGWKA
jgi:hypothetical protein